MLELLNIKKYYHSDLALQIASLKLANGIYFIKGANGSGKTTLLKMIAGLLPFEGDIVFSNISLKSKPVTYRQQISWAETEPLYPLFMTGMDVIRLYCNIRKVAEQEAVCLLERYGMNNYVHNPIGTYSAGMIKKLSIVVAFLGNAELIMLDEPFITLDADAYHSTLSLIGDRNKNKNTGFLISSHQEGDKKLFEMGAALLVDNKTVILK